jgi:hypothetical protein
MTRTKPAGGAAGARKRSGKTAAKGHRAPKAGKAANPGVTTKVAPAATTEGRAPKSRTDTKQAKLIAMLQSPDGATIEDLVKTFGWQAHTVRGAIAGALKKKLGLNVTSEKVEGRGRVYRIAG